MNIVDILLLTAIALALFFALRKCRSERKKGRSCGGNCAGCSRGCGK